MGIINTDEVLKFLLDDSFSAYYIESKTGISRTTITNYRNKAFDFKNFRLGNALKIQKLINELKEQKKWGS